MAKKIEVFSAGCSACKETIDGRLASCCAGRGPEEHVLKTVARCHCGRVLTPASRFARTLRGRCIR
jgi:hypothetical protein